MVPLERSVGSAPLTPTAGRDQARKSGMAVQLELGAAPAGDLADTLAAADPRLPAQPGALHCGPATSFDLHDSLPYGSTLVTTYHQPRVVSVIAKDGVLERPTYS